VLRQPARLNIISHLLSQIPSEEMSRDKVELPKRQKAGDYRTPTATARLVLLALSALIAENAGFKGREPDG